MKYKLLLLILTMLISVGVFGQAQPRIRPQPSAKSACAEALDLLYRLGKVRSYGKPNAAKMALTVWWPNGDPEAKDVPREALSGPDACKRILTIDIDMTRTYSRKKAPSRRGNLAPLLQFSRLKDLSISGKAFTRLDMAPIARMTKLESLSLSETNLDDVGLRIVRNLTRLDALSIGRTKIRGAGLIHLTGLKRLTHLSMSRTAVGDGAMRHVGRLRALRSLSIAHTKIGNRGAVHFSKLRDLRRLDIRRTRLKGRGMRYIGRLRKLEYILMFGTPIGHLGFKYLAPLPSLRRLQLNGGQITNRSLRELSRARSWKKLNIWHQSWYEYGHEAGTLSYGVKGYSKSKGTNYINLRPTRVTGKALRYLRGINLTHLRVSQFMKDHDVRLAARWLKKLEKFSLGKNNTRVALWHVVHMPSLKELNIGCSKVVKRDLMIVYRKRPQVKYSRSCFFMSERFAWEPIKKRGK